MIRLHIRKFPTQKYPVKIAFFSCNFWYLVFKVLLNLNQPIQNVLLGSILIIFWKCLKCLWVNIYFSIMKRSNDIKKVTYFLYAVLWLIFPVQGKSNSILRIQRGLTRPPLSIVIIFSVWIHVFGLSRSFFQQKSRIVETLKRRGASEIGHHYCKQMTSKNKSFLLIISLYCEILHKTRHCRPYLNFSY